MKKVLLVSAVILFSVAMTVNIRFNSEKKQVAVENAEALAMVAPSSTICVRGIGNCSLDGVQMFWRELVSEPF